MKRTIQKHIIDALSSKILSGEFVEGDALQLGLEGEGQLVFRRLTK